MSTAVSMEVIGCLGGASRQAVSKSGNPFTWLQARVRRVLVPSDSFHWSHRRGGIPARARSNREEVLEVARRSLERRRESGRPRKDSPVALAEFLGVPHRSDEGLLEVFCRFVDKALSSLVSFYKKRPGRHYRDANGRWRRMQLHWWKLRKYLDEWLPRWVNKGEPDSWEKALAIARRGDDDYYDIGYDDLRYEDIEVDDDYDYDSDSDYQEQEDERERDSRRRSRHRGTADPWSRPIDLSAARKLSKGIKF